MMSNSHLIARIVDRSYSSSRSKMCIHEGSLHKSLLGVLRKSNCESCIEEMHGQGQSLFKYCILKLYL